MRYARIPPQQIGGKIYNSIAEIAVEFGCSQSTARLRIARAGGSLIAVADMAARDTRLRCVYNGVAYASRREAARANGLSDVEMGRRLNKMELRGLTHWQPLPSRRQAGRFVHQGVTYASVFEASSALGVSVRRLYGARRRAQRHAEGGVSMRNAVTFRGAVYPSRAAGARALGVTTDVFARMLRADAADVITAPVLAPVPAPVLAPVPAPVPPSAAVCGSGGRAQTCVRQGRRLAVPRSASPRDVAQSALAPVFSPLWSPSDDFTLLTMRADRACFHGIAAALGRARVAVEVRFHRLRVVPNILDLLRDYGLSGSAYPAPGGAT